MYKLKINVHIRNSNSLNISTKLEFFSSLQRLILFVSTAPNYFHIITVCESNDVEVAVSSPEAV